MTDKNNNPPVGEIFTIGAFCEPCKWTDPDTGKVHWRWMVRGFEDDSYMGGDYVDPAAIADTREGLINETESD